MKGMATQPKTLITPEQYLERERASPTKSEYYRGEMFAVAGASEAHVLIVSNLNFHLRANLTGRDCRVYTTDLRLLVSDTGLYTYPDVMVVCGRSILADQHGDVLTNPILIIEVLSESTKDYDRGGKFQPYRHISSLREYLTVSQTEMLVEHSVLQSDGGWLLHEIAGADGAVPLTSLGIQLSLSAIYENLPFTNS
jgi:Uma2 family endonuclease